MPPKKEDVIAVPRASPALPFFAISCPSIAVADAEGVPGMLSSMAEIDPPVIPEEKSPRRRQKEVTGGSVKVRGSRRTIPRLMVSPGVDPINKPNSAPIMEAEIFCNFNTSIKAAIAISPIYLTLL